MDAREVLRFTTAGSVDDGKSTLIGRLLLESRALYSDQIATVLRDSERRGHPGLDLSLFTDGLKDEREQKITIDVAYRYFSTPRRKFIIADCPGHLQYTRNMVTGASTSELAVLLLDARRGLTTQTRRHAFLSTLLGIPHLLVAVNKMDLIGYDQAAYDDLCASFRDFASRLEVKSLTFLPLSAWHGDNVVARSEAMPWYQGGTLLHYLETINVGATRNVVDFRFPVQTVLRPHQDFRGYAGRVVSGRVAVGEEVQVLPSGVSTRVAGIDVYQETRSQAEVGDAVVLRLADEVDVGRGDLIVRRKNLPLAARQIDAVVCWLGDSALDPRREYLLRLGTRNVRARVAEVVYRIDVDTMHRQGADSLELNDIGRLRLEAAETLHFDPYRQNRETGCFLLIDRTTQHTMAAGMVRGPAVSKPEPEGEGEGPAGVVWLTGLSGAGKSTLAQGLRERLQARGVPTLMLDGDDLRQGLCSDLGFSEADRSENLRRAAHVAQLASRQGLLVIAAFISPFARDRVLARSLVADERFLEVHVHCPLAVLEERDTKGLYTRARSGELSQMTGIDSPYEAPESPELRIDTSLLGVEQALTALEGAVLSLFGPL